MFGLTGLRLLGAVAGPLAIVAAIGGLAYSRGQWKDEALDWRKSTVEVSGQIGNSIGKPNLKYKDLGKAVNDYALAHGQLVIDTEIANARIGELGAESKRLKALNAELRVKAKAEITKRNRLIDRLESASLTPGDRNDCQAQIAAAEAALDAIFEEGL